MSSLHALLRSFGQMLPPGSTIYVLAAELPDGRSVVPAGAPAADDIARSGGELLISSPVSQATPRAPDDPVTRVAALRAEYGADAPLKLRDWTKEIGIPVRELKRGIRHGALAAERKPDGRDNKALTITIGVMEAYLVTVRAVERGEQEPPAWWTDVRGGSRATA